MKPDGKCVIEFIKQQHPEINEHLRSLNIGYNAMQAPPLYRHIETGQEFVHLAGAIAWPGKGTPGFVIIVGVSKASGNAPLFTCLDEIEDYSTNGLLKACLLLRVRYGFNQSDNLLRFWYGDSKRFSSLINDFNQCIKKNSIYEGINIIDPTDFRKPNHFENYLYRIQNLLVPDESGGKSLVLENCNLLRNYLQNLPPDAPIVCSEEDFPSVSALGGLVHSLLANRPWEHQRYTSAANRRNIESFESYFLSEMQRDPYSNACNERPRGYSIDDIE